MVGLSQGQGRGPVRSSGCRTHVAAVSELHAQVDVDGFGNELAIDILLLPCVDTRNERELLLPAISSFASARQLWHGSDACHQTDGQEQCMRQVML